ncbi:BZ3500_MvSof-1268-A1-R1_Chr8-2g10101 [Microbotryum saponariae]|uniref:BZ3500_MvSof-1268-A1-R1_Chr8-2g10101 protein n=1 Tax=Microbotryum saponariae TaxID=289078 RepID=A0A2X0LAU3_9BASI|nr:BZ3500_MvSof-1268-A1-R1_Chr8-2g10101 [Microbotryum saponariae]SDA01788.1 BZ3501_MvSof-1269-A2-R1_Chr8-2g09852 [Microbotryum saponariae]
MAIGASCVPCADLLAVACSTTSSTTCSYGKLTLPNTICTAVTWPPNTANTVEGTPIFGLHGLAHTSALRVSSSFPRQGILRVDTESCISPRLPLTLKPTFGLNIPWGHCVAPTTHAQFTTNTLIDDIPTLVGLKVTGAKWGSTLVTSDNTCAYYTNTSGTGVVTTRAQRLHGRVWKLLGPQSDQDVRSGKGRVPEQLQHDCHCLA